MIAGLWLSCDLPAFAQGVSTNGLFGQRNIGSTVSPGQRSLTGTPGDRLDQQMLNAGQITGGERYLRDSRQPGQFVGSDSSDTSNVYSQSNGALSNALGLGPNRAGSAAGRGNGRGAGGSTATTQLPFRPTLRVRFRYSDIPATQVRTNVQRHLNRLERKDHFAGQLLVRMEGHTAVLQGSVATEEDRGLAQRLVALEAGVSAVRNELVVESAPLPREPEDLPPSSVDSVE